MIHYFLTSITLGLLAFSSPNELERTENTTPVLTTKVTPSVAAKREAFESHALAIYTSAGLEKKGLRFEVFRKALVGFQNLKQMGKAASGKSILSIVDFTKSSSAKRLWIIDLKSKKVLFNTLVAHGRNTGQDKATKFSNTPNSYMSSLGFYLTANTYYGKHGLSLRMQGMDDDYNSNAMARAIVVHGADYVSEDFVRQYGRLGRSLGCPSVPRALSKDIINTIKERTVYYIHGNDSNYNSPYLDENTAVEAFALETELPIINS